MSGSALGLDHLMVTTGDLARSRMMFERLGFQLTPEGRHESLGTANHTAMFADGTYLELLTVVTPAPANAAYRTAIAAANGGVGGIALKVDDATDFHDRAERAGLSAEPPVSFGRWINAVADTARFTIVRLASDTLPPLSLFACQHHTPDYVWRPDLLDHPNGVLGIDQVAIADNDNIALGVFAALFDAPTGSAEFGRFTVHLAAQAAPRIDRVTLRVEDLTQTRSWLRRLAVPHRDLGDALSLEPAETPGLTFEFRRTPADGRMGWDRDRNC